MSISKHFIEKIEITANDCQTESPSLHWYECLDYATLKLTDGKRHFIELSLYFQQQLMKTPADLKSAVGKVTRELKQGGMSHTEARKMAASRFGIDKPEDVKKLSGLPGSTQQEIHALLQKASGRSLARTVSDFLSLPKITTFEASNYSNFTIDVEQLDFISVPVDACIKHGLKPSVIIDREAYLPIAVINIDGKSKDYQLPLRCTEYVLEESRKFNFLDEKFKIRFGEKGVEIYKERID